MIDILLINPQPVVMKDLFAENLMYANPPLGLGYLASAARNAGYSVDLIDVGIDKLTISGIIHRIIEVDAQIVGISSFIANHGNGLKIAHEIKKQFGSQVKVMMGGPQASFVYEEVLKQGDVDIVSIFEGEQTIVELLNCIKTGGDLKKIAGIAFVNEEGEVIKTERRLPIQDLDTIDFPAWDLFKIDKYQEPGIVLTGRGCPYKCIFCSAGAIAGGRYRMRSVKNVVDEIEMLYKTYGIKKIFIADDTFTASEKHCIEICREIRNRNLDIAWQAEARANTVTDLVAAEMAKAGCHHVQIGAESGDNEILKKIGKNVTTDTIERAVRIFLKHPIVLAHKLAQQLTKVRKDKILPYLRPDGKTQVTIEYDEEQKPIRIEAVVLSTQQDSVVTQKQIHTDIKKYVFDPILPIEMVDENTKYFINPTGRFVVGGPNGDSGLTGRKIIVDTYGGYARHGGGAFSGKDCTKVDRSAAYAARYIAKNIVAAGLAEKCEIQLSYAIGVARPMSIMVDTFGTSKLSDSVLSEIICRHFDLRPTGIIKMLNLRQPIYKQTSAYGHFGRDDLDLSWEKTDKIEVLKEDYNSIISKKSK